MADVHTPEQRSYNMSQIRNKNTQPEILVRKFLHANGLRFRVCLTSLPGKPDIVFTRKKIAIFIHGCFWHGHEGCKYFKVPSTRTEWWLAKINRNKEKDIESQTLLESDGWQVMVIHECELKPKKREETLGKLLSKFLNVQST